MDIAIVKYFFLHLEVNIAMLWTQFSKVHRETKNKPQGIESRANEKNRRSDKGIVQIEKKFLGNEKPVS